MKKILSFMSAAALFVTFAGCGDTSDSSSSEESTGSGSSGYEDAVYDYFDAVNSGDSEKLLSYMYPEKVCDYLKNVGMLDALDIDQGDSSKKMEVTEIVNAGESPEEEIAEWEKQMSGMVYMVDLMDEYGLETADDVENLSADKQQEIMEKFNDYEENYSESLVDITTVYDLTVRYTEDGEPDEDYFYAYYVEGEGWKLDNSMRRYIKKSKQTSVNASASSIGKAYNSALTEMDESDVDISGTYIICSDSSKNVNIPGSLDVDGLNTYAEMYFSDMKELNWFVFISNGTVQYTVVTEESYGPGTVGTWPAYSQPTEMSDGDLSFESDDKMSASYDELYQMCSDMIK